MLFSAMTESHRDKSVNELSEMTEKKIGGPTPLRYSMSRLPGLNRALSFSAPVSYRFEG